MDENIQMGPLGIVQDLSTLEGHIDKLYEENVVPWVFIKRSGFPPDDDMFNEILRTFPDTQGVIISIIYRKLIYC